MTDPVTTPAASSEKMTEAQRAIEEFWPEVAADIHRIKHVEPGNQLLPLARIKKIMKLDEDVKMISAEAPLLFAKAAEIFIQELTMRAWLHTEDNKRRTLQRSDIAMAIAKYDMFDFLIDIVPREEIRPANRREFGPRTSADDTKYYFQLAQQHQLALQQDSTNSSGGSSTAGTSGNVVQVQTTTTIPQQQPQFQTVQQAAAATPQIATIATPGPNIILTNPATGTLQNATTINPVQLATQGQPIQLMQQVLTPTGEVTHIPIPINQTQLNFIRTQMQLNQAGAGTATATAPQPIIIQAPQLQTTPTIIQTAPGLFLNAGHIISQHQPQHQQPQQIQQHQIQQQIQQQQQQLQE